MLGVAVRSCTELYPARIEGHAAQLGTAAGSPLGRPSRPGPPSEPHRLRHGTVIQPGRCLRRTAPASGSDLGGAKRMAADGGPGPGRTAPSGRAFLFCACPCLQCPAVRASVPQHGVGPNGGDSSSSTDLSDPDSDADSDSSKPCRYLLNTCSDVLHVAIPQAEPIARRSLHEDGQDWATACGVQLSLDKSCYELLDIAPASALPCRRPACQRALGLREPARPEDDDASSDAARGDD